MATQNNESEQGTENRNAVPILTRGIGTRISAISDRFPDKKTLAQAAGLSESQLYRMMGEHNAPKLAPIAAIAKSAGVSLEWLATGEGPMELQELPPAGPIREIGGQYEVREKYAAIEHLDARAHGIETGSTETPKAANSLAFSREWLTTELAADPTDLTLLEVHGGSMHPTLNEGDTVLINHSESMRDPEEGIYLMRVGETLILRRLQPLPGGEIQASSDDDLYPPFSFHLGADDVTVIGRVVWSSRVL